VIALRERKGAVPLNASYLTPERRGSRHFEEQTASSLRIAFLYNFIEQELNREKVSFRKNDNAFLAVSHLQALQAAANRFTAEAIRKRLDY
jgi:hypothetical protein